jgi:hypothetical protein
MSSNRARHALYAPFDALPLSAGSAFPEVALYDRRIAEVATPSEEILRF